MNHYLQLAAAAAVVVVVFVARGLVSISSLVGFLNSHWKYSAAAAAAVLLFAFAAQLLAAAAVAVTGLAQCTGSRDLTRQSVALSPDLFVQLAVVVAVVVVVAAAVVAAQVFLNT